MIRLDFNFKENFEVICVYCETLQTGLENQIFLGHILFKERGLL